MNIKQAVKIYGKNAIVFTTNSFRDAIEFMSGLK